MFHNIQYNKPIYRPINLIERNIYFCKSVVAKQLSPVKLCTKCTISSNIMKHILLFHDDPLSASR